jgi:hypothetical protein
MNISSQLEELANGYDHAAMDALVQSLTPAQLEEYKQEILDAYDLLYSLGLYELDCNRITDPEDFILTYLLEILDSIKQFFPDELSLYERGNCYVELAKYTSAYENKVRYIDEAIRFYDLAPQDTDSQALMVRALTDKMVITKQYTTEAFATLLSYFRPLLHDPKYIRSVIHECFRIRGYSRVWFEQMLSEFEAAMAERSGLEYLDWAETYHYILFHNDHRNIEPAYVAAMVAKTAVLLKPLEGYYTEDPEMLNRLGKAFADTAKRSTDHALQLEYYRIAVDFFTKGHEQQPAAWTFPVYATNALLGMAEIYYAQGAYADLINTFEHGLQLFSQVYEHEKDFQLNIYWGDFLLTYAGMAYDYRSASINLLAEEKLKLSAVLGNNYYSHPYMSLARLAIKSGDKEKCVQVLFECRDAIRATGYDAYDLSEALEDEDFKEVWDQLR